MGTAVIMALIFCLAGLFWRLAELIRHPQATINSRARGSARAGVVYAYTLGLAPWSKESTRRHPFSYARGILFHIGIAAGMIMLVISFVNASDAVAEPLLAVLWALVSIGAVGGWFGLAERLLSRNLRALSIPDDYVAVALVSIFLTLAALYPWVPGLAPVFQAAAIVLLVYIPLGKITHLVYWVYVRFHFGYRYGYRGVVPKPLVLGEVKEK